MTQILALISKDSKIGGRARQMLLTLFGIIAGLMTVPALNTNVNVLKYGGIALGIIGALTATSIGDTKPPVVPPTVPPSA